MKTSTRSLYASLVLVLCGCAAWDFDARGEDWPEFRGPGGQGHSAAKSPPLSWSETEHVTWKVAIPGAGWSSPVIVGKQVWLTTSLEEGKSLRVLCIDRESGKIVHNVEVFTPEAPAGVHSKNNHASPTPIVEQGKVYVHFGTYGTACLDTRGKILWRNAELKYAHGHGPGGSPVLFRDLLVTSCDGTDQKFVVALDKNTGKVRWKTERSGRMAYSTPLVISAGGRDQVVSPGGDQTVSYDPLTGEEIWRCKHPGYSVVPRPVFAHGLVFYSSSYDQAVFYAVRADGSGDVSGSHIAWQLNRQAPHNPSPLVVGDEIYLVSDGGVASCLDARTGEKHWQERLSGAYSASPLFAAGRIYFLNETGLCTAIKAAKSFEKLAENTLEGRTLASLAAAGESLFLRTDGALYRIDDAR